MKQVKLTQGRVAVVDDADYEWLNQFKWCFSHGYAQTRSRGTKEYMHRVIMNAPKNKQVDHTNGSGVDNQRSNLRLCTSSDNQHNRGKNKNNKSGYKNIWFDNTHKMWDVRIMYRWKNYGKKFKELKDAVEYRDSLVIELHGKFARTENA